MNEEKRKSEAESRLLHYLSQHHMRCTPERMMILGKVVGFRSSFTPSPLLRSLTDDGFHISQATVYNSLRLLETAGIVRKRLVEGGIDTYEYSSGVDNHISLVCSRCGRSKVIKDVEIVKALNLRRFPSFVMNGFDLYIRGLCSKCRSGGRVKK